LPELRGIKKNYKQNTTHRFAVVWYFVYNIVVEEHKLSWAVPAYTHSKKTVDWFWALGIVAVTGSIISILLANYFFAFLIIIGGGLMAYFAHIEPETLYYELNKKGLKIKDRLYPYKSILAFWVDTTKNPTLFIKTDRVFLPVIPLSINHNVSAKIREVFISQNIIEEEMKEHPAEILMEFIGY